MSDWYKLPCLFLIVIAVMSTGCVKHYRILNELEQPLPIGATLEVGTISDGLPFDYKEENKPTIEDIMKIQSILIAELSKKDFPVVDEIGDLVVEGVILDWNKGSGVARFLFGFGIGSAKLTMKLELIDTKTHAILFGGNFDAVVSDGLVDGDETFKKVAKNFAKQLSKQIEKLAKQNR